MTGSPSHALSDVSFHSASFRYMFLCIDLIVSNLYYFLFFF